MKNIAIILAAGNSKRCGFDKLFTEKFGEPVINQTCKVFQQCEKIDEILLVVNSERMDPCLRGNEGETFAKVRTQDSSSPDLKTKTTLLQKQFSKISNILSGGTERFFSLEKAVQSLKNRENCRLIVHNGANPNLKISDLEKGITLAEKRKNVIFGFFTKDSIKRIAEGKVVEMLNRDEIFQTQTPQISDLKTFINAFGEFNEKDIKTPRDEAELLGTIGEEIFVYECCPSNQKITFPQDFEANNSFRIGVGEDSHHFAKKHDPNKPLTLGGVVFEDVLSVKANSDGDVILHALCNAILSAVGEKTLDSFAGKMCQEGITDSQKYVKKALKIAKEQFPNFEIKNVICSLECKTPRIKPKHEAIIDNCAKILDLSKDQIGLTYTSGEDLSDFGKGLGVRCLVEILITI